MPVFHFILHAYGTWHPDNKHGWHQHGEAWAQKPNVPLGSYRKKSQRWEAAEFHDELQHAFLVMTLDMCQRRKWRCHAVAINETHLHAVISWFGSMPPDTVQHTAKRLLGWRAAKVTEVAGRRWFSDGGKALKVSDRAHLLYLVREYLPQQGGIYWKENEGEELRGIC
jgi:hypothetical protein